VRTAAGSAAPILHVAKTSGRADRAGTGSHSPLPVAAVETEQPDREVMLESGHP
jgi:hypothetical protein